MLVYHLWFIHYYLDKLWLKHDQLTIPGEKWFVASKFTRLDEEKITFEKVSFDSLL